jgi:hypothetical protein
VLVILIGAEAREPQAKSECTRSYSKPCGFSRVPRWFIRCFTRLRFVSASLLATSRRRTFAAMRKRALFPPAYFARAPLRLDVAVAERCPRSAKLQGASEVPTLPSREEDEARVTERIANFICAHDREFKLDILRKMR